MKVSVIIPCYNQVQFLTDAVESVMAQTFDYYEIIIVDDGSSPPLEPQEFDGPGALIWQENQGLSAARNRGVRASIGEYILPLDADDMLDPTFLEKAVAVLDSRPDIHIVGCDCQRFGLHDTTYITCDSLTAPEHLVDNHLNYCSMYRREVWEAVGGYDVALQAYEDWDFWLACIPHNFQVYKIPEFLFNYRIHEYSKLAYDRATVDTQTRVQLREKHGWPR